MAVGRYRYASNRILYFASLGVVLFLLISCGATVATDYDRQTDFSIYKTYAFYPSIESGLNELDDARIMKAIDSVLQQRNYQNAEDNNFYINFYARQFVATSNSSIGIGIGGGSGNVGMGVSGGIPVGGNIVKQSITIDLIDAVKDELIWQAIVESELKEKSTPAQKDAYYYALMEKVFMQYPPVIK